MFERPIPGQSLTTPEKSSPYEKPADVVDPIDALNIHLDNLNDPEVMEGVTNILEINIDMVTAVEGILRSAVLEGIHSLDVSILIAPHIHEYIKGQADVLKLDYDEGFVNEEMANKIRERAIGTKIMKDLNVDIPMTTDNLEEAIPEESEDETQPSPPMQEEAPQGLMARRTA